MRISLYISTEGKLGPCRFCLHRLIDSALLTINFQVRTPFFARHGLDFFLGFPVFESPNRRSLSSCNLDCIFSGLSFYSPSRVLLNPAATVSRVLPDLNSLVSFRCLGQGEELGRTEG